MNKTEINLIAMAEHAGITKKQLAKKAFRVHFLGCWKVLLKKGNIVSFSRFSDLGPCIRREARDGRNPSDWKNYQNCC